MEPPPLLSTQTDSSDTDGVAADNAGVSVTVTPSTVPPASTPSMHEPERQHDPRNLEGSDTLKSASYFEDEEEDVSLKDKKAFQTTEDEPELRGKTYTRNRSSAQFDEELIQIAINDPTLDPVVSLTEAPPEGRDRKDDEEEDEEEVESSPPDLPTPPTQHKRLGSTGGLPKPPRKGLPPSPNRRNTGKSAVSPAAGFTPPAMLSEKVSFTPPAMLSEKISFTPPAMLSEKVPSRNSATFTAPSLASDDPLMNPPSRVFSLTETSKTLVSEGSSKGDPSVVDAPEADLRVLPEGKRETSTSLDSGKPQNAKLNRWSQKMDKVTTDAMMKEWNSFGNNLTSVRKALSAIAAAQKKFSEKVDKIIAEHGLNLHSTQNELLATWTMFFQNVQISAARHKNCASYIAETVDQEMASIQKNDKHTLGENKKKYKHSIKKTQIALIQVENTRNRYKHLVELSKEMADPDWKPKDKRNWMGKRERNVELPSMIIGRTYDELLIAETQYHTAVDKANEHQKDHEETVSEVKNALAMEQTRRINYSMQHLQKLGDYFEKIVNGDQCKSHLGMYKATVKTLDKNTLLTNEYIRLISDNGKRVVPKDVKFIKSGWKNIFVSVEEAMVSNSGLDVPLVLHALCSKVKDLNGFQTQGIFRKSATQNEKTELRRQLLRGDYKIRSTNPHVPACVLKDWLRNLKDPLIPHKYYHYAIDMAKENRLSSEQLDIFLSQLDKSRRNTIIYLVKFLRELLEPPNPDVTLMTLKNLAIVFGPNIIRFPTLTDIEMLQNSSHEQTFCHKLVQNLKVDNR